MIMKYLSDYAVGSGTTEDVCRRLNVQGVWTDLRLGFDLLSSEIPDIPENIFYHPPYYNMNGKIIYSNTEYSWQEVKDKYGYDPRRSDLSQAPSWESFIKALNYSVLKQYAALEKGGHMGILMGDIKTKGHLYSMLFEIAKPGTVEQVVIKTQHNCVSDKTYYGRSRFIPTMHEYFLILRKDEPYIIALQMARKISFDVRDCKTATWKDVVAAALNELGGQGGLSDIYREIEGHKRCETNQYWRKRYAKRCIGIRVFPVRIWFGAFGSQHERREMIEWTRRNWDMKKEN